MERVFRSLKTQWILTMGYLTMSEAKRDIGDYFMSYYDWERPHRYSGGLTPAVAEEKLNSLSGISLQLQGESAGQNLSASNQRVSAKPQHCYAHPDSESLDSFFLM